MNAVEVIRKAIRKNQCCIRIKPCMLCNSSLLLFVTTEEELYLSPNCKCVDHFSALQKKPHSFLQQLLDEGENNNASSEKT